MANTKRTYEKTDKGDLSSISTYPEVEVEVTMKEGKVIVGKQPSHQIVNIIHKDKVPTLLKFLEEQKEAMLKQREPFETVLEQYKGMGDLAEKFLQAIQLIPTDGKDKHKYASRLDRVNQLAKEATTLTHAQRNLEVLNPNLEVLEEQITFIKKNWDL